MMAWRFLTHPVTLRISQIAIGVIFLAAGLAKVGDIRLFAEQVHNFRIVPVWSENLLAMTLPWMEVVAGLSLVLKIRPRSGAFVVTAMMAVFTVAVASAVLRGLDIECGCFGTADAAEVGWRKLAENTGMLALSVISALRPRR